MRNSIRAVCNRKFSDKRVDTENKTEFISDQRQTEDPKEKSNKVGTNGTISQQENPPPNNG